MSKDEHKAIARRRLLKGAAAIGALAVLEPTELAQATQTEAAGHSPVGTWLVQVVDSRGATDMDLTSLTKDGLVFDAGGVPLKAPPKGQGGPPTPGLGAWARAAGGGFDLTFVSLAAGADGALMGTVTISGHATLGADGNTFSGAFTLAVEAGGKVLFSDHGTVTGTRVKVKPM